MYKKVDVSWLGDTLRSLDEDGIIALADVCEKLAKAMTRKEEDVDYDYFNDSRDLEPF